MAIKQVESTVDKELERLRKARDLSKVELPAGRVEISDVITGPEISTIYKQTGLTALSTRGDKVVGVTAEQNSLDFLRGVLKTGNPELLDQMIQAIDEAGIKTAEGTITLKAPAADASPEVKAQFVYDVVKMNSKTPDGIAGLQSALDGIDGLEVGEGDRVVKAFLDKTVRDKDPDNTLDKMIAGLEKEITAGKLTADIKAPARDASDEEKAAYVQAVVNSNLGKTAELKKAFDGIPGLETIEAGKKENVALTFSREVDLVDVLKVSDQKTIDAIETVVNAGVTAGKIATTGKEDKDLAAATKDLERGNTRAAAGIENNLQQEVLEKLGMEDVLKQAMRTGSLGVLTKDQTAKLFGEGNSGKFQLGFDEATQKFVPDYDKGTLVVEKGKPKMTVGGVDDPDKGTYGIGQHLVDKGKKIEDLAAAVNAVLTPNDRKEIKEELRDIPSAKRPDPKTNPDVGIQYIMENGSPEQKKMLTNALREFGVSAKLEETPGTDRKHCVYSERVPMMDLIKERMASKELTVQDVKDVMGELGDKRAAESTKRAAVEERDKVHGVADSAAQTINSQILADKSKPLDKIEETAKSVAVQGSFAQGRANDESVKSQRGFFNVGGIFGDAKPKEGVGEEARIKAIVEQVNKYGTTMADKGELVAKLVEKQGLAPESAGKIIVEVSGGNIGAQVDMLQGAGRTNGRSGDTYTKVFDGVNAAREGDSKITHHQVDVAHVTANASKVGSLLDKAIETGAINPRVAGTTINEMVQKDMIDGGPETQKAVVSGFKPERQAEVKTAITGAGKEKGDMRREAEDKSRRASTPEPEEPAKKKGGKDPLADALTAVADRLKDNPAALEALGTLLEALGKGKGAGRGA